LSLVVNLYDLDQSSLQSPMRYVYVVDDLSLGSVAWKYSFGASVAAAGLVSLHDGLPVAAVLGVYWTHRSEAVRREPGKVAGNVSLAPTVSTTSLDVGGDRGVVRRGVGSKRGDDDGRRRVKAEKIAAMVRGRCMEVSFA